MAEVIGGVGVNLGLGGFGSGFGAEFKFAGGDLILGGGGVDPSLMDGAGL